MNLTTLLAPLEKYDAYGPLSIEISGLSYDSRRIQKGALFAALPGTCCHGIDFVPQAIAAGAAAVISDRKAETHVTHVVVPNPRLALAKVSNAFYAYPSTKLDLFGVTGTNGKTTSTFLMHSILEKAGRRCGLIGTIQYRGPKFATPAQLTTPESLDLQQLLAAMLSEGCGACVMEVSSHSLAQYRAGGCRFRAAIFTNLTQDHLDYHQTMEQYFQAKMMLFDEQSCHVEVAVINIDDPYGARILSRRPGASYGFGEKADYRIQEWNSSPRGSEILIRHQEQNFRMTSPLIARFNAYNIAGVFAAMHSAGIDQQYIIAGIEQMKQVPGRLERIDYEQPYLILIDYAHTEDAMRQLLTTVRPYAENRIIVLFGCGGDRDPGKRPLMGRAAGELADVVILTSDNPRTEDPEKIMMQIYEGVLSSKNENCQMILDRTEAIAYATQIAKPGDAVVLAGKGHEDYQIIGTQKFHFDEREILRDLLTTKTQRHEESRS